MKKIVFLLLMSFFLTSCSLLRTHKIDIEQGNVISEQGVKQLQMGMSEREVKAIMGTPILINSFSTNEIYYIYTLQTAYHPMVKKRLSCVFQGGKLKFIQF